MKVRVTQEIESETPGQPHKPGTIIDRHDAWWLCTVLANGEPVAEPIDDEAKAASQPFRDRRERVKKIVLHNASKAVAMQREAAAKAEELRLAEFEEFLRSDE